MLHGSVCVFYSRLEETPTCHQRPHLRIGYHMLVIGHLNQSNLDLSRAIIPAFDISMSSRCLPESIRWLITMKRYDEARRLINRASKMNGASVPLHLTATPNKDADGANSEAQKQTKENLLDVLRITSLRNRIILLFCAW